MRLQIPELLTFERGFIEQLLTYLLSKPCGEVLGFVDEIRERCQEAAIEEEVTKQPAGNGAANQQ